MALSHLQKIRLRTFQHLFGSNHITNIANLWFKQWELCSFLCNPRLMYSLDKIRLRYTFVLKSYKYMLFSCSPPSNPVAQWLSFSFFINKCPCYFSMSIFKLNFCLCFKHSLWEGTKSIGWFFSEKNFLFDFSSYKWNWPELHLLIKSSPYTCFRAFQSNPRSC